ncbi:MAG: hypothetical protein JXB48_15310 [Candidatus Latescibacteria bacterium]|nr:hypothetical protein [Candidatus Latescibacterota bacterium]
MRTKYSKTYTNLDGSYSTIVYLKPIHKKNENGEWVDKSFFAAKSATDSVQADIPEEGENYLDAYKYNTTYGFSDDDGGDEHDNIVGYLYEELETRTYRQMFWWDLSSIYWTSTINILDMYYTFNNVNSLTSNDTVSISMVTTNPITASAQTVYVNATWEPFTEVDIQITSPPAGKKYTVDLSGDIGTLEYRINNTSDEWYAVHHKMKTEGASHGCDICGAQVGGEDLGYLYITWEDASEKIAAKKSIKLTQFPNPFNPVTTLNFNLHEPTLALLDVYSINGQKVDTLCDNYLA